MLALRARIDAQLRMMHLDYASPPGPCPADTPAGHCGRVRPRLDFAPLVAASFAAASAE